MNFVLKIVRGANAGAEIALPEDVAVSLGKSDDCDIVLADATLPDGAMTLKAAMDGVTLDGEPLEPFVVAERGATAFAVGPADAPWGELKWPEREREEEPAASPAEHHPDGEETAKPPAPQPNRHHHGCLGCFLVLVLLLLALGAAVWIFREQARPYAERIVQRISRGSADRPVDPASQGETQAEAPVDALSALVGRGGLELTSRDGHVALVGDFATRAERLAATAEAYAAQPGIELDFCDDESLRAAAEDTFSLVGEKGLRVEAATNRVLVLSGTAANLLHTLKALAADLPKLRNVDCSSVVRRLGGEATDTADASYPPLAAFPVRRGVKSRGYNGDRRSLPVCGILTAPYPCLVLKNGARVMEGAPLGDSVVVKIESDSVTLTNSTGRFTWKP